MSSDAVPSNPRPVLLVLLAEPTEASHMRRKKLACSVTIISNNPLVLRFLLFVFQLRIVYQAPTDIRLAMRLH